MVNHKYSIDSLVRSACPFGTKSRTEIKHREPGSLTFLIYKETTD
jgi:hypothetical protein